VQITSEPAAVAKESHLASKASKSAFTDEQELPLSVPFKVEYLHSLHGLQENTNTRVKTINKYFIRIIFDNKDILIKSKNRAQEKFDNKMILVNCNNILRRFTFKDVRDFYIQLF
jgi:hypothetical protein